MTPTGTITLGNVQTEFGGANPAALGEYYRGGAYVNSATAAGTSGVQIATSGLIRLGDFRGVQSWFISQIGSKSTDASRMSPGSCQSAFSVKSDGTYTLKQDDYGTIFTQTFNWYTPTTAGIGASYWVKMTQTSGTALGGSALTTWLSANTNPVWTLSASTSGAFQSQSRTAVATVQIASDSAGSNIVSTGTITFHSIMETNA